MFTQRVEVKIGDEDRQVGARHSRPVLSNVKLRSKNLHIVLGFDGVGGDGEARIEL